MSDTKHVFDVVVVGGGGSGLAAAIEAASLGRSVVLIEKNPTVGGSTIRSIGSISATNTPHQLRKGIKDTPEEHFEDLGKFNTEMIGDNGRDNEELRRILVANVGETFRWLMNMGVTFFGPTPEPPHRKPRMHNVLPNSRAYGYFMERRARKNGVDIRTCRRARRFLVEGGAVKGVETVTEEGIVEHYMARGGIVLSSGDYSASEELKAKFGKPGISIVGPTNPTNTGDGHLMAMEQFGTPVLNGHMLSVLVRFVPPPKKLIHSIPPWGILTAFMRWSLENMPAWLLRPFVMSFLTTVLAVSPELLRMGAVLVNKRGERIADDGQPIAYSLARQPEQSGYIIFDETLAKTFSSFPNFVSTAPGIAYAYVPDYLRSRPDIARKAADIRKLAHKIGVDPFVLEASLSAQEEHAGQGERAAAGGSKAYYALGPVRSYVNLTDGGLAIDSRFRVLDGNDRPIAGLYAAGSAGQGGVMLEGHGHHLGWAFTSGRLAGRNAAFDMSSPDMPDGKDNGAASAETASLEGAV